MNLKSRIVIAALAGVSVIAVALAAYGYRTRAIAMNGWAEYDKLKASVTTSIQATATAADYREALRLQIAANAGIEPGDNDHMIAEKLTRHLYNATLFGGKPFATTRNSPLHYFQTINHEVANMCGNLSTTLVWALDLFDIPARSIVLASESFVTGKDIFPTHAFVEARIEAENIVFDPTFSTVYKCDGSPQLLDARGLQQCARDDKLEHIYLSPPRPGRSLEEYPATFHQMSFAIEAIARPDAFYTLDLPEPGWRAKAQKLY